MRADPPSALASTWREGCLADEGMFDTPRSHLDYHLHQVVIHNKRSGALTTTAATTPSTQPLLPVTETSSSARHSLWPDAVWRCLDSGGETWSFKFTPHQITTGAGSVEKQHTEYAGPAAPSHARAPRGERQPQDAVSFHATRLHHEVPQCLQYAIQHREVTLPFTHLGY